MPSRHRDITVKTVRQKGLNPLWAIGALSLAAGIGIALLTGTGESDPVVVEDQATKKIPAPAKAPEPEAAEVVVTDEVAGEMTGVFVDEPAVAPSALPRAEEQPQPSATAAPPPPRRAPRPAARRAYRPRPKPKPAPTRDDRGTVSSSGIIVKDPYE